MSEDVDLKVQPIERLRQLSLQSRDAMDAWARHAAAANGFGDGAMGRDSAVGNHGAIVDERPWSPNYVSPLGRRLRAIGEAIVAGMWAAYWLVGAVIRNWTRTSAPASTYRGIVPKTRSFATLRQSRVS